MYFDNNATTALDPRVFAAMQEEFLGGPSNPSSIHSLGQKARGRLSLARHRIATFFGVAPSEVLFTSGATEALNQAIASFGPKRSILSSHLEHAAVLGALKKHQRVHLLSGEVTLEKVQEHLDSSDLLVFMAANNETGVKSPIEEIASLAYARGIPLIVDGVALMGKEAVVLHPGITAFVFSPHKFHGPKGIGCLITRGLLSPLIVGGSQENGRRAGTENLAAILGMAKALELIDYSPLSELRNYFESLVLQEGIEINGTGPRVANTSNLFFEGVEGEMLLFHLDQQGIACSHGSACSSGTVAVSHVLLGLGFSRQRAAGSLRFSFSRFNTREEICRAADILTTTVKKLRK